MVTELKPKRLGNVYLREIEESDYKDYYEIGSSSLVTEYLNWGPFHNPSEALYTIREIFFKRPLDGLPKGYAITIDNKMIGMIDFHSENLKYNSIEIGYFLSKDYWGLGIMHRCLNYMTELAFSLGFSKVRVGSFINNLRSIHLIEACGFSYELTTLAEKDIGVYLPAKYYVKYNNEEW